MSAKTRGIFFMSFAARDAAAGECGRLWFYRRKGPTFKGVSVERRNKNNTRPHLVQQNWPFRLTPTIFQFEDGHGRPSVVERVSGCAETAGRGRGVDSACMMNARQKRREIPFAKRAPFSSATHLTQQENLNETTT